MKHLKLLLLALVAMVAMTTKAQIKTYNFVSFDEQKSMLINYGGVDNWYLHPPTDGSNIIQAAHEYLQEECVLLHVSNSQQSINELVLTSDFKFEGKVRRIILKAAGWIQFIAYLMPNNMMKESNHNSVGSWDEYIIDFEEPIELDGPLKLYIVTESYIALQSLKIVMGDSDDSVTSTFNGWQNPQPTSDGGIIGLMTAEEGYDWEGFMYNSATEVAYTSIGSGAGSGTSCIMTYLQEGHYNVLLTNNFELHGKVEKIVVRAAGNLLGLEASIDEYVGTEPYRAGTQVWASAEFTDYVIPCTNCPDFEDTRIRISIYGQGAMYIHSVTIIKNENLPELPSGECGENLAWRLEYLPGETTTDRDQNTTIPAVKLVIEGSGAMRDFGSEYGAMSERAPWAEYKWNITTLEMSDDITYIGANAFPRYWNLHFYDALPSKLQGIGSAAFYNIYIWKELRIPEGVTKIGSEAFLALNGPTDIYIPKGLTDIGGGAFADMYNAEKFHVDSENPVYSSECDALSNKQTKALLAGGRYSEIPEWIETIETRAVSNTKLENVKLPDGLLKIGYQAFWYADIKEVHIPDRTETIDASAFENCSKLLSVYIGKGVKNIAANVFRFSQNILDIYCYANPDELTWTSGTYEQRSFMADGKTQMHVRAEDLSKWQTKFDFLNVTFVGDLVEGISPIYDTKDVDVAALQTADLTDNTVDNVYYNLNPSKGCGYINGALVIGQSTDMSAIGSGTPGSAEVSENFNGIILKVNGKGTISIDSRVFGKDLRLAVRIGNGTPIVSNNWDRIDRVFSYNVTQETYVYIYAVGANANARIVTNRADDVDDNTIVIYGIKIEPETTGIANISQPETNLNGKAYDVNGRALNRPRKGLNIIDGRKVLIR